MSITKSLLQLVVIKSLNSLFNRSTKFHLKECNRCKLIDEGPSVVVDNILFLLHAFQYNLLCTHYNASTLIKPSESTLYLSKGSSKTMVLLPGANIELTVSKSILSNTIHIRLLQTKTEWINQLNHLQQKVIKKHIIKGTSFTGLRLIMWLVKSCISSETQADS